MIPTLYWFTILVVILAIIMTAFIVLHVKHRADMGDTVALAVCAVLLLAFGIPLIAAFNKIHQPVKVIITDMDGKVSVYESERGLVDDDKDYWRIYDKDVNGWLEFHNFKSAQLDYLEK